MPIGILHYTTHNASILFEYLHIFKANTNDSEFNACYLSIYQLEANLTTTRHLTLTCLYLLSPILTLANVPFSLSPPSHSHSHNHPFLTLATVPFSLLPPSHSHSCYHPFLTYLLLCKPLVCPSP